MLHFFVPHDQDRLQVSYAGAARRAKVPLISGRQSTPGEISPRVGSFDFTGGNDADQTVDAVQFAGPWYGSQYQKTSQLAFSRQLRYRLRFVTG